MGIIIESMFNIYDEEITLETKETDLNGETIIVFENGKTKTFDSYENACKWAEKHGYIN